MIATKLGKFTERFLYIISISSISIAIIILYRIGMVFVANDLFFTLCIALILIKIDKIDKQLKGV